MVEAASADRGRRVAEERLGRSALPQIMNWEVQTLKSEIQTYESVLSVKDKELALLRQKLVESNKLLDSARKHINALEQSRKSPGMVDDFSLEGSSLLESFQNSSVTKQKSILGHLEKVLKIKSLDQLNRAVDKLVATETKYSELVKAVCVRDCVDINKISHGEILRSIRSGDSLKPSGKDEIKKRSGLAWTWNSN
jgi:hypothetical protein